MNKLNELNIAHLIIRPHLMDEEKFKAFTPFCINWIFKKSNIKFYSISEELGENGGYHLDILILSNTDIDKNIINNKGKQIGLSGHARTFMETNLPNSQWNYFFKNQKENKKNDKLYNINFLIGYNLKEQKNDELKNWNNLELSSDEIDTCIKFYEANKSEKPLKMKKDIIPLNNKNAMFEMKKYLESVENPEYHTLITDTIMKGYCWIGLPKKSIRKLILQLKLIKGQADDYEIAELNDDIQRDLDPIKDQLEYMRHQPRFIRLQYLYENGFLKKEEFELLTQ